MILKKTFFWLCRECNYLQDEKDPNLIPIKLTELLAKNWTKINKKSNIWQQAVFIFFPPGGRTYQKYFLSLLDVYNNIQKFSFVLPAPFSLAKKN